MSQATIWVRIIGMYIMLVVGETRLQIMVNQIRDLAVNSFKVIPIFVAAHGTFLHGHKYEAN